MANIRTLILAGFTAMALSACGQDNNNNDNAKPSAPAANQDTRSQAQIDADAAEADREDSAARLKSRNEYREIRRRYPNIKRSDISFTGLEINHDDKTGKALCDDPDDHSDSKTITCAALSERRTKAAQAITAAAIKFHLPPKDVVSVSSFGRPYCSSSGEGETEDCMVLKYGDALQRCLKDNTGLEYWQIDADHNTVTQDLHNYDNQLGADIAFNFTTKKVSAVRQLYSDTNENPVIRDGKVFYGNEFVGNIPKGVFKCQSPQSLGFK